MSKQEHSHEFEDDSQPSLTSEQSEEVSAELKEKQLSPQEQLEAMRLYVQSMQKTEGHSKEEVRNIIDAVYRRLLLVLNYSPLSKAQEMKDIKLELKKVVDDEMKRYAEEV